MLADHALVFRPELLESVRFERELRALVLGYLHHERVTPKRASTTPGRATKSRTRHAARHD